ncbi:hypothetical protein XFPR_01725 [Xylella fastidiosa]|uniref:hypothetical protein n=1 Tax=Xylella fastidiosa TaxID=2371 RepID=UPI0003D2BD73|nr:hypothetical protein [Xylella fastidiosa]ALR03551.1 hypothetical protein XFPR_01725 [Xylella fastidiosa]OJZ72384.1 hypothetical protein B375_0201665 [Xylella fastidiosa 6c]
MSSTATMTTTEYAKHRGVSDSYIRRMRRKGKVVLGEDGRIHVNASDTLLDGMTNPVQGGKRGMTDPPASGVPPFTVMTPQGIPVQEAVRRERVARALKAELDLGKEAEQLTCVDEVNRAVFTLVRQALNQLRGMSGRLRKTLAAETDAGKVTQIIDTDVAHICKQMRDAAAALLKTNTPDADPVEAADANDTLEFEEEGVSG